jgi:hypothetical protein
MGLVDRPGETGLVAVMVTSCGKPVSRINEYYRGSVADLMKPQFRYHAMVFGAVQDSYGADNDESYRPEQY